MTKVVFRVFEGGDVIALFAQEPATADGWECMSYMHVGQHGAASTQIISDTKAATKEEYAPLLSELQRIGYTDLKVCKRFTNKDYQIRKERVKVWQ